MTEANPFPWDTITYELHLSEVELVATFGHDGGAISERVSKLRCTEGRLYSYETTGGKALHQLEYFFGFAESMEPDPMASTSSRARIVITGIHENGLRIEVRGDGWVGYDNKGKLEGRFERPPIIITEDDEPLEEPHSEVTEDQILSGIDFPMPPKYNRATTRAGGWSDAD